MSHAARASVYLRDLHSAIGALLPHTGLPLLSTDTRLRWTDRLLVIVGLLMSLISGQTLLDRFHKARQLQLKMHPGRKNSGESYGGFVKRLIERGQHLLDVITPHLRLRLEQSARCAGCWETFGFAVFGVDSTTLDCPRTHANRLHLGTTGTDDVGSS